QADSQGKEGTTMSTIEKSVQKYQEIGYPGDIQGLREIPPNSLSLLRLLKKQMILLKESDRNFTRFSQLRKDVVAAQDDITKAIKKIVKLAPQINSFTESFFHLRALLRNVERWE